MRKRTRSYQYFKRIVSSKLEKTKKNNQNDEKDYQFHGYCRRHHLESPAAKSTTHITQALTVSQLIFKPKGQNCHPRMTFCNGTMTLSTPPPQSGTFNGGKGAKMIHQPSYLLSTTTADFFCFREVKLEQDDLLLSQGGLMTNLEGVIQTNK
jgi:hypothetical protein